MGEGVVVPINAKIGVLKAVHEAGHFDKDGRCRV